MKISSVQQSKINKAKNYVNSGYTINRTFLIVGIIEAVLLGMGLFYFDILNTGNYLEPTGTSASNPYSVAVIFYYKNFSFFTAGDITTATEEKLLANEDLPEVTLYKASHHGSHGSNSQELLDTLNPKAVAISAARANQYQDTPGAPQKDKTYNLNAASGHPAADAIERIYKAPNISQNLNVYWNVVNGTMKFTTGVQDHER